MDFNDIKVGLRTEVETDANGRKRTVVKTLMTDEEMREAATAIRRALRPDPPQSTEAEQLQATQAAIVRQAVSQLETELGRRLNSSELELIVSRGMPTSTEEQRAAVKAMVGTSMNDERWVEDIMSDPFNKERAGKSIVGDQDAQKRLAGEIADFMKRPGNFYDR